MTNNILNREQWLTKACNWILDTHLMPIVYEYERPEIRVSMGFAYRSNKAIGQCFKRDCSKQSFNEIFIKPDQHDSARILDILVHELIHAIDNCESGHRGFFRKTAKAVGLTGKMTATKASEDLKERLNEFIVDNGDIPHAEMNLEGSPVKKQSTRMLKLECDSCGFTARTSNKWLQEIEENAICPACGNNSLNRN